MGFLLYTFISPSYLRPRGGSPEHPLQVISKDIRATLRRRNFKPLTTDTAQAPEDYSHPLSVSAEWRNGIAYGGRITESRGESTVARRRAIYLICKKMFYTEYRTEYNVMSAGREKPSTWPPPEFGWDNDNMTPPVRDRTPPAWTTG